jgi:tRNA-2-methylthio-N6-dimethylallyladenosine synthase
MNEADSEKLAAGLANLGWVEAARADEADLAVVNTCVVRQKAEDRAVGYMSNLRRLKESRGDNGMQIAVMGCMVGPKTDDLRSRFPYVDVWARPQNFEVIIRSLMPESDLGGEFWPETFPEPKGPTAFVPIVHGCNKFCTYCIVPYRRGRERSRTMDEIEREVRSLAAKGVREVTLLGQTVEAYGRDLGRGRKQEEGRGVVGAMHAAAGEVLSIDGLEGDVLAAPRPAQFDRAEALSVRDVGERGPDLADLFERISAVDEIERIRFLTSYPRDMTERIVRAVAELPKVCEHFNIPVQSGDDEVLAQMRRGYTLEEYRACVAMIRKYAPEASLSTDVIVGFCGETEAQFENTLRLLEDVRYDKVHVAMYSPRPGTIAWRHMEDTVPAEEKSRRLHAVEELQERVGRELNARYVGTVQEVLVEGFKDDVWTGRNRGNKLVHFTSDESLAIGEMMSVRVERATAWSLQGVAVAAERLAAK